MEDALALTDFTLRRIESSLNPCFNGRCTRTSGTSIVTCVFSPVLILVLMEDALAQYLKMLLYLVMLGLNPCFNGRCTRTDESVYDNNWVSGLNPCFNGRCTRTRKEEYP